jgi:streptogramin lyase
VTIQVVPPLPALDVGTPLAVGPGPGVPAVQGGSTWVPTTNDGGLVRIAGGAVASRTQVGPRSQSGEGYLDAAVAGGGAIWSASDVGGTIARVDPVSGATTSSLSVPDRPGGLTEGDGSVWAFHFLQTTITRIDEARSTASRLEVPDARAAGLAYGGGSLWLLSINPSRVQQLDPANGAVRRTIPINPAARRRGGLIDAWWLAYGEGAVWATLPNYDTVARVDAATGAVQYVHLDQGQPFGIAVGGGSAWVATDRAVAGLDGATGKPIAASSLPARRARGLSPWATETGPPG